MVLNQYIVTLQGIVEAESSSAVSQHWIDNGIAAFEVEPQLWGIQLLGTPQRTDNDALDTLNYMLSAPAWSSSMLEDACAIVRSTGRQVIDDAEWERH